MASPESQRLSPRHRERRRRPAEWSAARDVILDTVPSDPASESIEPGVSDGRPASTGAARSRSPGLAAMSRFDERARSVASAVVRGNCTSFRADGFGCRRPSHTSRIQCPRNPQGRWLCRCLRK